MIYITVIYGYYFYLFILSDAPVRTICPNNRAQNLSLMDSTFKLGWNLLNELGAHRVKGTNTELKEQILYSILCYSQRNPSISWTLSRTTCPSRLRLRSLWTLIPWSPLSGSLTWRHQEIKQKNLEVNRDWIRTSKEFLGPVGSVT